MTAKQLLELRDKRKNTKTALDGIVQKAIDEKRDLTTAEEAEVTTKTAELADIDTQIDAGLDKREQEERTALERAEIEAEARREERLAAQERSLTIRGRRRVEDASGRDESEIRVHDAFPMLGGNEPRSFAAVYGDAKRGRTEAYKAGMWAIGHLLGNEEARQWSRDYGYGSEHRGTLNNVAPTAGAVLVPDGMVNSIIWNVEDRGVFARYANKVPMGKNDIVFVPKSTGEVTVYAVAENQTDEVTESEPTFDGVEVTARTWGVLTRVGRNLLDDAVISVGEHVSQKFGYGIADKQDVCGFNGTGTSTYHGIHGLTVKIDDGTHTASVSTAASGNTTFGTLDLDDFEAAVGKLPQWAEGDDVAWYISKPGYYASMARLMDAAGGNTQDNVAGGKGLQFLGYPVRITQVLHRTLTSSVSTIHCLFGSLRKTSAMGTKKELAVQTLVEKYATYNQVGLLGFARFGINNHELGDTTNPGAMIALKTPGS
jgi:HK97 family phage major capsid protein